MNGFFFFRRGGRVVGWGATAITLTGVLALYFLLPFRLDLSTAESLDPSVSAYGDEITVAASARQSKALSNELPDAAAFRSTELEDRSARKIEPVVNDEPKPTPPAKTRSAVPGLGAGSDEPPEATLSIAGSVLDDAGAPLPGIAVLIRPGGKGEAVTDELGMFAFGELQPGEYELSVIESKQYHGRSISAPAGAGAADMHLQRKGSMMVAGQVTDETGAFIENVLIRQLGRREIVRTDVDGAYRMELELTRAGGQPVLDFTHPQHRAARERVSISASDPFAPVQLDVVMASEREKAAVLGVVEGPRGEPVADAHVAVSAAEPRAFHETRTDGYGRFLIEGVEVGAHYRLSVKPREQIYKRYLSDRFAIGPGDTVRDVMLENGGTGEVWGVVVDPAGAPVSGLALWLRNPETPAQPPLNFQSGSGGLFGPVEIASGTLIVETPYNPRLSASGIQLEPGESKYVEAPLDWGQNWLFGQVVDENGDPVGRATVVVQWSQQFADLRSASRRETRTDMAGYFNLANLAAPEYQLTVQAPGFRTARIRLPFQPGEDVTVELKRAQALAGGGS